MSVEPGGSLRAFRDFANTKLSNGGAEMTLDEALDLWEYENSPASEKQATLAAIARGLEDADAGRTLPAEQALADLCRKHGIAGPR